MALAYPTLQRDALESSACDCFLDALDDPDLALKVRERAPADLDEALTTAMRLEAWANDVRRQTKYHDEKNRYRNRGVSEDDNGSTRYNQTVNDGVAHSKSPKKCAHHVTFDLDLEHSVDAR